MTLWASLQTGTLAEKVMHEKLLGFHLQWSHLQTQMDHNIGSKADTGDLITKSNTDSSVVQALDDQIMSVFAEHLKSGTKKTPAMFCFSRQDGQNLSSHWPRACGLFYRPTFRLVT